MSAPLNKKSLLPATVLMSNTERIYRELSANLARRIIINVLASKKPRNVFDTQNIADAKYNTIDKNIETIPERFIYKFNTDFNEAHLHQNNNFSKHGSNDFLIELYKKAEKKYKHNKYIVINKITDAFESPDSDGKFYIITAKDIIELTQLPLNNNLPPSLILKKNEYVKSLPNFNGGRRRSRHAKKTRRNKRHVKKTRRHRKH